MMNTSEQLGAVAKLLSAANAEYALTGGLVASLYRQNIRMTADVDFLFFSGPHSEARARKILEARNLEVTEVRKAQLEGGPLHAIKRRTTPILLLAGRPQQAGTSIGVDFLLPGFPWFERALERAQQNYVDFGGIRLPCLTAEDLVLSKLHALSHRADRFQDLDDIKEIFLSGTKLDLNYLSAQMRELKLKIPSQLKNFAPDFLIKTSKSL